jgi:cobaltochelatase CobS
VTDSTLDIEEYLARTYYLSAGPHPPHLHPQTFPLGSHLQVRQWLASLGVDASKIDNMSDRGVENAYNAGRNWVRKNLVENANGGTSTFRMKPRNTPRNTSVIDLSSAAGFRPNEQLVGLLSATEPKPAIEPHVESESPPTQSEPNAIPPGVIHAALESLALRLRSTIDQTVKDQLNKQIESAGLSTKLRNEVRDLAREMAETAARDAIDQSLPKRIEIITSTGTRTLPAEARHECFERCLRWLEAGESIYLVGPAGTGKTHLGEQLAQATDKRFLPVPQALTKYEFSGFIDGSGVYRGTIFRDGVENGGQLMIDEIDSFAAAAVMFLNSVIANGWCAFPDGIIKKHPDFRVVAAANTYGRGAESGYLGRNPLDAASLDRFAYIAIDYDQNMERQLFGNGLWVQYVHKVRAAVKEYKIQHVISMRAIARCINGANVGLTPDEICEDALWRGLGQDSIAKILARSGPPPTLGENIRRVDTGGATQ